MIRFAQLRHLMKGCFAKRGMVQQQIMLAGAGHYSPLGAYDLLFGMVSDASGDIHFIHSSGVL